MNNPMRVVMIVLLALLMIAPVSAQDGVTVLCDEDFDFSEIRLPDPFPGVYYYVPENIDWPTDHYQIGKITDDGTTILDVPLSPQQALDSYMPIVSPDGRFMAFRSIDATVPLAIWDMQMDEVVTVDLPDNEAEYLSSDYLPVNVYFNKLVWQDATHLVIQFFDAEWDSVKVTGQTIIEVMHDPLQVEYRGFTEVTEPELPVPTDGKYATVFLSPMNYASIVSVVPTSDNPDFPETSSLQIYRLGESLDLIFDLPPTTDFRSSGSPIWMPDELNLFLLSRTSNIPSLTKVNVDDIATIDPTFWPRIQSRFGKGVQRGGLYRPTLSPDGLSIAFKIIPDIQGPNYHIIYTPTTDQLVAICDPSDTASYEFFIPIWSENGEYFGYWNNGNIIMFDTTTGEAYRLPNPNNNDYVGWVFDDE